MYYRVHFLTLFLFHPTIPKILNTTTSYYQQYNSGNLACSARAGRRHDALRSAYRLHVHAALVRGKLMLRSVRVMTAT